VSVSILKVNLIITVHKASLTDTDTDTTIKITDTMCARTQLE